MGLAACAVHRFVGRANLRSHIPGRPDRERDADLEQQARAAHVARDGAQREGHARVAERARDGRVVPRLGARHGKVFVPDAAWGYGGEV